MLLLFSPIGGSYECGLMSFCCGSGRVNLTDGAAPPPSGIGPALSSAVVAEAESRACH